MRINQLTVLADMLRRDVKTLAYAYHSVAIARLGEFDSDETRLRYGIAINAIGMAINPAAYAAAYAEVCEAPLAVPSAPKTPVCNRCGSNKLRHDASARWDDGMQRWDLETIYDSTSCESCGAEGDDICKWLPLPLVALPPTEPTCRHCGSNRVIIDAGARWQRESAQWLLDSLYESAFCEACERDGDDLVQWPTGNA